MAKRANKCLPHDDRPGEQTPFRRHPASLGTGNTCPTTYFEKALQAVYREEGKSQLAGMEALM
jgi:hypothetical protein